MPEELDERGSMGWIDGAVGRFDLCHRWLNDLSPRLSMRPHGPGCW